VVVAEQTTASVRPDQLMPIFPACLVLGNERNGVSPDVMEVADAAVAIPMLGMANSLNVATAASCSTGFHFNIRINTNPRNLRFVQPEQRAEVRNKIPL
jgi:tRNA(Leu) C34 or U34 (ribose-2'-O)-methylase TrmL